MINNLHKSFFFFLSWRLISLQVYKSSFDGICSIIFALSSLSSWLSLSLPSRLRILWTYSRRNDWRHSLFIIVCIRNISSNFVEVQSGNLSFGCWLNALFLWFEMWAFFGWFLWTISFWIKYKFSYWGFNSMMCSVSFSSSLLRCVNNLPASSRSLIPLLLAVCCQSFNFIMSILFLLGHHNFIQLLRLSRLCIKSGIFLNWIHILTCLISRSIVVEFRCWA